MYNTLQTTRDMHFVKHSILAHLVFLRQSRATLFGPSTANFERIHQPRERHEFFTDEWHAWKHGQSIGGTVQRNFFPNIHAPYVHDSIS